MRGVLQLVQRRICKAMPPILTLPRTHAPALPESGCWPVHNLDFLHAAVWQSRAQAEHDEAWLQPIPYLVLRNPAGQLWCYQRCGGDARLDGRCSCGVGGHVDLQDAQPPLQNYDFDSCLRTPGKGYRPISSINLQATLQRTLLREVAEELGAGAADLGQLTFQGLIYEGLSAIGRVHLGVLFSAQWLPAQPPQPVAGEALRGLGFQDASAIANNPQFELWSRLAARHLP
jgi:predicted NUDIX family phosphoesterase